MKKVTAFSVMVFIAAFIMILDSCKKDASIPTLTTSAVSSVTSTSARSGGVIISGGGADITQRGVCWSTSRNPTTASSLTNNGTGSSTFQSLITGLTPSTTYYVRSYAINSAGTGYGNEISFLTGEPVQTIVNTLPVKSVGISYAVAEGNISSAGDYPITEQGICLSINNNPTIADTKIIDTTGALDFTCALTGLTPGTQYFLKAYAINQTGAVYGQELNITTASVVSEIKFYPDVTYGSVADTDGNSYKTVQIGTQVWMAENLKTTKLNNGEPIPLVTDISAWSALAASGYCWYDNKPDLYKTAYGALYNGYAVATGKLCPVGWHVPTSGDYDNLNEYLTYENDAGSKMKETGITHWADPNGDAVNLSGWTGLPGGLRIPGVDFTDLGFTGWWWSITTNQNYGLMYSLRNQSTELDNDNVGFSYGGSVRCIMN